MPTSSPGRGRDGTIWVAARFGLTALAPGTAATSVHRKRRTARSLRAVDSCRPRRHAVDRHAARASRESPAAASSRSSPPTAVLCAKRAPSRRMPAAISGPRAGPALPDHRARHLPVARTRKCRRGARAPDRSRSHDVGGRVARRAAAMADGRDHRADAARRSARAQRAGRSSRTPTARSGRRHVRRHHEVQQRRVVTHYGQADGLVNECVRTIARDREGRIWAGTEGERVHVLEGTGRFKATARADGIHGYTTSAILQDRDGASGWERRTGCFDSTALGSRSTAAEQGVPKLQVNVLRQDRAGALWIGMLGGLTKFGERDRHVLHEGERPDPRQRPRRLRGPGRRRLDRHLRRRLDAPPGRPVHGLYEGERLFDNVVSRILVDDRDRFWMSGNRGVFRVDRAELNAYAAGAESPRCRRPATPSPTAWSRARPTAARSRRAPHARRTALVRDDRRRRDLRPARARERRPAAGRGRRRAGERTARSIRGPVSRSKPAPATWRSGIRR